MLTMLTMLRSRCRPLAALLLVLFVCTGCAASMNFRNAAVVELSIRQAQATGRPGVYRITGTTTLPEQTRITVAAVRDFQPSGAIYAILDRQFATVQQGNWEATLNLWQVAPDGRFQESWQLSGIPASADPAETVTVLATLDPANRPSGLQDQIEAQDDATQATLVRFTTDGELYLEASRQINLPLPSDRTTPPAAASPPQPRTSGRPVDAASPDRSGWSQTSAPLSPNQQMR